MTDIDMPTIPNNIVNVTRNNWGYLTNAVDNDSSYRISVGVATTRLLPGKSLSDVKLFYFDEESLSWKMAIVDNVIPEGNNVEGAVPGGTNYFAGLIKSPEMPEASAFLPTAISDIKAANPAEGMNIMQPPSVSRTGEASIHYPLEIPAGRQGMQPDLALTYNSDKGTGCLGVGWDISMSTISVDSRWGVPTFPNDTQEEVYLLNGSSLVEQGGRKGNRNPGPRTPGTVRFFERTMSSYKVIERKGQDAKSYMWVVTDADGTKYYYGTINGSTIDENGVRRNSGGYIVRWYLRNVKDKWGNYMRYSYTNDENTTSGMIKSGGWSKYLSKVRYTRFGGEPHKYEVAFHYTDNRADATVSSKLGFKEIDDKTLDKITVSYGSTEVKYFKFHYTTNDPSAFFKTRLDSVAEYRAGNHFYSHSFEYYSGDLTYGDKQTIKVDHFGNRLSDGVNPAIATVAGAVENLISPSPLKTTVTTGWGAGGSLGLGVAVGPLPLPDKTFTFSGRLGYSETNSHDKISIDDFNGDGLPDLIYDRGSGPKYYPLQIGANQELSFSSNYSRIKTGQLMKSKSTTFSYGFDFAMPASLYYYGKNWSKGKSSTSIYLTDYNADGIKDIVNGNIVTFGRLESSGDVTFSGSSEATFSAVKKGVTVAEPADNEVYKDMEIVRSWEAPFSGIVEISGLAEMSAGLNGEATVAMQHNNGFTANGQWHDINISNPAVNMIDGDIEVEKGDKLLFRVRSDEDGQQDLVNWVPQVNYVDIEEGFGIDGNGLNYASSTYEEGFLLSGGGGVSFDGDDAIQVSWPSFEVNEMSDDVVLKVNLTVVDRNSGELEWVDTFEYVVPSWSGDDPVPSDFKKVEESSPPGFMTNMAEVPDVDESHSCHLSFEVWSTSNVLWKNIDWRPEVKVGNQSCGAVERISYPVVYYNTYNRVQRIGTSYQDGVTGNPGEKIRVWPQGLGLTSADWQQIFIPEELSHNEDISYTAYLVSKAGGNLLSKMAMVFHNNQTISFHEVAPNGTIGTAITFDDPDSDYWFDEGLLLDFDNILNIEIFTHKRALSEVLSARIEFMDFFYAEAPDLITSTEKFNIFHEDRSALQDYYLHWGQFCWSEESENPISTEELHLATEEFANEESNDFSEGDPPAEGQLDGMDEGLHNPMNQTFFMLTPQRGEETASLREYIKDYHEQQPKSLDRWSAWGLHIAAYRFYGATAPGKFGEPEEDPVIVSQPAPGNYGAFATTQKGKSYTSAKTEGNGLLTGSQTINDPNKFYSEALSMFMDINGDGFPDIISNNGDMKTSLTSPTGGHRSQITFSTNPQLSKSTTNNSGLSIPGTFINEDGRFVKASPLSGNASVGSSVTLSDWTDINGDGLVDKTVINSSTFTVELNNGKGLGSAISISNGGLSSSSNYSAGLGANFSLLDNLKPKLGMSFSVGAGINISGNKSEKLLMDFTGDGLPDLVTINSGGTPGIFINTGTSFEQLTPSAVDFSNVESFNKGEAIGISGSAAASIAIPLFSVLFFNFKMSISGNGQINFAVNELKSSFRDMNGDGVLDYVQSNGDGDLEVYFAQIKQKNLLKKVTNPLNGSFTISYEKVGNKYGNYPVQVKTHNTTADELMVWDMPEGKWVMSKLILHDGLELTDPSSNDIDGEDEIEYLFNYDGGIKSRREREFLGFTRTETVQPANIPEPIIDDQNKIYTSEVTEYERATSLAPSYRKRLEYVKGVVTDSYTLHHIEQKKSEGDPSPVVVETHWIKLMEHRVNEYEYRYVETAGGTGLNKVREIDEDWDVVNWNNIDEVSTVFPALISTQVVTIPQTTSPDNFHAVKYELEYDEYTNVTEYRNEGVFTEGSKTTEVVGSINNDHYKYIVKKYPMWYIEAETSPFANPFHEDPVTGDKCFVIPYTPDLTYSNDTICISALYFNDPCNFVPPPGEYDSITAVHRKLKEEDIDILEDVYTPVFEGPIIAKMTYFEPGDAVGRTSELKSHKIYLGSTANNPERHTEVNTLHNFRAPKVIWNYLDGSSKAITSLTYDNYGNVTSISAPQNHQGKNLVTNFDYDPDLNQYVVGVNNSYGDGVCMKYDLATGNLRKKEDINGRPIQYEYDTFYRLKEVWGPDVAENTGAAPTIAFSYYPKGIDPDGTAMERIPVAITSHGINGPFGISNCAYPCTTTTLSCTNLANVNNHPPMDNPLRTATFTDGIQRVMQIKKDASKANGTANSIVHTISGISVYDRLGRKTNVSLSVEEDGSTPIGEFNNNKSSTTVQTINYDYANRPLLLIDIAKGTSTFTYNWNDDGEYYTRNESSTDVKTYTDAWQRTYKIEQATSDVVWGADGFTQSTQTTDIATTTFDYDALNQLKETKNPLDQITSYTYDRFGRMKTEVHPDKGTSSFTYDHAGNLIKLETPATGTTGILMEYDYNRLLEKTYPNFPEVNNVVYTYGSLNDGKNGAGK